MCKFILVILLSSCAILVNAQGISQSLQKAYQLFENDPQLKHALSSLYVVDAATGNVVFEKNAAVGLAPASTQKIITAAAAFELLGKAYRYKTKFFKSTDRSFIVGYGDPTLGSWRFDENAGTIFFDGILQAIKTNKGREIGTLITIDPYFDKLLPAGWVYQDIGNYYGAGANGLNWQENQYDVTFFPGKRAGDKTTIDSLGTSRYRDIINRCTTGRPGSGDNAYLYFIPQNTALVVSGTVPAGVKEFTISGADPYPACSLSTSFYTYCKQRGIDFSNTQDDCARVADSTDLNGSKLLYTHYSPALDSIIYWFLQKSINLYGEALVKTFAYEKNGYGATDTGVDILKNFWKQKGIDAGEINLYDGSGLSPFNRVTTHAQVEVLKYAKKQPWFNSFYAALPEFNGMKMKSGTINDVKSFCGYHTSKGGREYIFSFIVNNYNGITLSLVNKMYKVLDNLK